MPDSSLETLTQTAQRHVTCEAASDFDGVMATLEEAPVMSLYPCGLELRGRAAVERFYRQLFAQFMPRIVGYELLSECVGAAGVTQEYDITLSMDDGQPQCFRVMAILTFGRTALTGERLYASETFLKIMFGPTWDELRPI